MATPPYDPERTALPHERAWVRPFEEQLRHFQKLTQDVERERVYSKHGMGHAYGVDVLQAMALRRNEAMGEARLSFLRALRTGVDEKLAEAEAQLARLEAKRLELRGQVMNLADALHHHVGGKGERHAPDCPALSGPEAECICGADYLAAHPELHKWEGE